LENRFLQDARRPAPQQHAATASARASQRLQLADGRASPYVAVPIGSLPPLAWRVQWHGGVRTSTPPAGRPGVGGPMTELPMFPQRAAEAAKNTIARYLVRSPDAVCPACSQAVPLAAMDRTGWIIAHACTSGRLEVHVERAGRWPWAWQFVPPEPA
jgi:hypothetical protein